MAKGKHKEPAVKPPEKAPKWPCTVDPQVWAIWKKCVRWGDQQEIARIYGWSDVTISKAIKYGYAKDAQLIDNINTYFLERLKSARATTTELLAEAALASENMANNGK